MGRFQLYQRDDQFFEDLVWHLCFRLFGAGTEKFAVGKDGAKDARFPGGTAQCFPSTESRWVGTTIIQAKHTKNPIASCSDSAFGTIMRKEVTRIAALKKDGKLDHYVCFTNRKRTGVKSDALQDELRVASGIPDLLIYGVEYVEAVLAEYDDLIDKLGLSLPAPGLTIYPESLEQLINYFDQNVDLIGDAGTASVEPPFARADWPDKNRINRLSTSYFEDVILQDSLVHFSAIDAFLKDPRNLVWAKRYESIATQFRNKYHAFRDQFGAFELIFDDIFNRIKLRGQVPTSDDLIYLFLHFMYCNCDLGRRTQS